MNANACEYVHNTSIQSKTNIVIYSTSWCHYCIQAKQFLNQLPVNYSECDIENSAHAKMRFKELQGQTVPLIYVGDIRIDGFNAKAIEQALIDTNNLGLS